MPVLNSIIVHDIYDFTGESFKSTLYNFWIITNKPKTKYKSFLLKIGALRKEW